MKNTKPARRMYVLWAVALVVMLSTWLFCWKIAVPFWNARDIVWRYHKTDGSANGEELARLKDNERMARALYTYVRLPDSLAPYPNDAMLLLVYCERPGVPYLIRLIDNEDRGLRLHAVVLVGTHGDERAVPPLVELLGERDRTIASQAACGLVQLGEAGVEALHAALRSPDARVRYSAAEGLGVSGQSKWAEPLIAALKDPVAEVRGSAAIALGRIGASRTVPLLIEMLGDEDKEAAHRATEGLKHMGEPAVEPLIAALKDKRRSVRVLSAHVLGTLKDGRAVAPLLRLLSDDDWGLRASAVEALGVIGDKRAEKHIKDALKDKHEHVREIAEGALLALELSERLKE